MAKKQPMQSTFEFTGNTSNDGEHTYNLFIQRDNKGREISMASNNAMYVHNVTMNDQIQLNDTTQLEFRADHPAGDYEFQTKLKDGRVFHGTLTQAAQPEKEESAEEPTPAEENSSEDQPERFDSTENDDNTVTVNSADQSEQAEEPSQEEPASDADDSSDEEPEGNEPPSEESDDQSESPEEVEEGEEPIQGSSTIIQDDLYTVQLGQEDIQAQGSVGDVFNTAFDLLAREDIVQINRNGEYLTRLHREVKDGQYVMTHEPTEDLTDEEGAALQSISRRIITGQIKSKGRR